MTRWIVKVFGVSYTPQPDECGFLDRAELQKDDELEVRAAVLDNRESERFFGVPMARRGIQPVWLEIRNRGKAAYRLRLASIDPDYFPPLEAAYVCHFRIGRRFLEFGLLALLFIHILLLLPFKLIGAYCANKKMNEFFVEHGVGWGRIVPGQQISGFVFTKLDEGTKRFTVRLLSRLGNKDFAFSLPIPGLRVDHHDKDLDARIQAKDAIDCDEAELRRRLADQPRCTTNSGQSRDGDPLNLVAIGDFDAILSGFGARWDETETISFKSCWRTFKSFSLGSSYRYSPVSSLYVEGRSQDFALQKARQTINERLHLRLWVTPLRFEGKPVWIGQVSRDIGVRFTYKTWNLTTHKIDPDVDDARDYVLDDLLESEHVALVGYVPGAGAAERTAPRHNLTGDPYFTDGQRAVAVFSAEPTKPRFLNWT
jgi:LssY C-terminus